MGKVLSTGAWVDEGSWSPETGVEIEGCLDLRWGSNNPPNLTSFFERVSCGYPQQL